MEGGSVSDNRDEFLFLLGVQKGMTFENIEKLLDEIANEKVKLGIPSPTNLFKKQYCPTKKDCKFFHLCAPIAQPRSTAKSLKMEQYSSLLLNTTIFTLLPSSNLKLRGRSIESMCGDQPKRR